MSPILRRENEYDPRKRRAAWWSELADAQREEQTRDDKEDDVPPIPEQSTLVGSPGKGISRHCSYGSDHGSIASDTEGMEVHVVETSSPYLKRNILHQALTLAIQSTPSLLLSLVGVIFTGQLLDHLAVWSVFRRVDELFILVPVLGNLKGNLEMCLGARLGTSANRGHLDTVPHRRRIITHALTYLLLQALVISSIAGVLSFALGLALNHRIADVGAVPVPPVGPGGVEGPHREGYTPPGGKEFTLVVGTGMVAACLSSLVLGSFMAHLVIGCRWLGLDPDNIASPLAATLGDLLTLFIMALVGSALVKTIDTPVPFIVVLGMCGATGGIWWALRVMAERRMRGKQPSGEMEDDVEEGGWSPLIGAMIISSATGLVLDRSVNRYKGFALLAVSITGMAGSIGAIHASRLSTSLHAARHHETTQDTDGPLLQPPDESRHPSEPGTLSDVQSAITLFLISWPVLAVFVGFVWTSGWIELDWMLAFWVMVVYGVTVAFSLYLAQAMTRFFWSKNLDPDSYCLPVHSSLIDLLGQTFLVVAFEIAAWLGADVINADGMR